jgi:aspartate dehydrogenase
LVLVLKVALIGCGAIGTALGKAIDAGKAGISELSWVYDLKPRNAKALVKKLKSKPQVARTVAEICTDKSVDLVIEAASQVAVEQYALEVLKSKKDLMVMSVGAFSDEKLFRQVQKTARKTGQRLYIPSGAVLGIDGIKAAIRAGIDEVILTTRKPPAALARVKYVRKRKLDLSELRVPRIVFEGTAQEAVKAFPKSVNVAATLSIAGIGLEKTKVRVVADPSVDRNVHVIRVRGKAGEFVTEAHNVPSPDNPKTSYLAALSALRTLRNLTEAVIIGT